MQNTRRPDDELLALAREPWLLRTRDTTLLVRPASVRDLPALARMHVRCSARALLDRYRAGGRPPSAAAMDALLRQPNTIVALTPRGDIVAAATLARDELHAKYCAELGVLVETRRQRRGIGSSLVGHLAGVAYASGYKELIAYPATAMPSVQRLMLDVGRTRLVLDPEPHLHTSVPESATLGLGAVRRRLAG